VFVYVDESGVFARGRQSVRGGRRRSVNTVTRVRPTLTQLGKREKTRATREKILPVVNRTLYDYSHHASHEESTFDVQLPPGVAIDRILRRVVADRLQPK